MPYKEFTLDEVAQVCIRKHSLYVLLAVQTEHMLTA